MNNKEFYIKKIGSRGKIIIWLVDGNKIRRDLDIDFTNFGQHFRFSFIPEYEFWLDKEAVSNERRFFIDHLLVEWRLMKDGLSYNEASDMANKKELSEREKAGDLKKVTDENGQVLIEKVRCRFLGKANNNFSLWLVFGRLVRSVFHIEFTEGGHDLIYKYIPKNEIWLDNDVFLEERPYIILHELYERSLMEKGTPYPGAHRKASKIEWECRQDGNKLQENLALLGWK